MIDFHDAAPQRGFDLIPANTVVPVVMTIRPGAVGDGGWATQSNSSDAKYLNCEFTVSAGPHVNRKIWQNLTISGGKVNEKGESIAWNITKSNIRAMLNSARGVRADDDSETARKARTIKNWGDLNGLAFVCKLKVEKGKDGYADKNQIGQVLEPGHEEYSAPPEASHAASAAPAPAWVAPAKPPAKDNGANLPAWAR